MELQLYASRKNETNDMAMAAINIRRLIVKNYSKTRIQMFHEGVKRCVVFPFEFIAVCLAILVSPFSKRCVVSDQDEGGSE